MNHTKEPWRVMEKGFGNKEHFPTVYATDDELRYICTCQDFCNITPTDNLANAKRIVACINFCAGLTNEELEKQSPNPPKGE
jgi:hypothetical protein